MIWGDSGCLRDSVGIRFRISVCHFKFSTSEITRGRGMENLHFIRGLIGMIQGRHSTSPPEATNK